VLPVGDVVPVFLGGLKIEVTLVGTVATFVGIVAVPLGEGFREAVETLIEDVPLPLGYEFRRVVFLLLDCCFPALFRLGFFPLGRLLSVPPLPLPALVPCPRDASVGCKYPGVALASLIVLLL
jgi:hypothetical protein